MNHVFLSGTVDEAPRRVSQENEIPHVVLELTVAHKTTSGVEKRERYPISAWRGIAKRMTEMIVQGSRVSIKGYLSQKQTPEGVYLEVTAEEFQVSPRPVVIRPLRRSIPFRLAADKSDSEKSSNPITDHVANMLPVCSEPGRDPARNQN